MQTTCGGTGTGAPSGVRNATNAATEEVAVNETASAAATRARSAGSGEDRATVR